MKNEKGNGLIIAILFIILIMGVGTIGYYKYFKEEDQNNIINQNNMINSVAQNNTQTNNDDQVEVKKVEIFSGNDRPIAVMIDNSKAAWPQAALNDAYIVYEIIVEGGETRLMALFKGKALEKIGPVRSARHYFLDYALENDSIYVHYGWSPKAETDIAKFDIDNINGITGDSSKFWRVKDKQSPHNAVISTKNILELAKTKGYRTTSDEKSILNYVTKEVNLEEGQVANSVEIPYSTLQTVKYEYDEETKTYIRYARGKVQTDWNSGENIQTKNIIITFAKNYNLEDSENKGRQEISNIGTLEGYYITNGKAIKIMCQKTSEKEKTIYKDMNGKTIEVNDGNTFIQICPIDADVVIE